MYGKLPGKARAMCVKLPYTPKLAKVKQKTGFKPQTLRKQPSSRSSAKQQRALPPAPYPHPHHPHDQYEQHLQHDDHDCDDHQHVGGGHCGGRGGVGGASGGGRGGGTARPKRSLEAVAERGGFEPPGPLGPT